jgi:hypothetical protein
MRLEQPEQPTEPPVRHDLFELDRKRKLLLEEVETIKRMKLEQVTFNQNLYSIILKSKHQKNETGTGEFCNQSF